MTNRVVVCSSKLTTLDETPHNALLADALSNLLSYIKREPFDALPANSNIYLKTEGPLVWVELELRWSHAEKVP